MTKMRAMETVVGVSVLAVVITGLTALSFCQSFAQDTLGEKPVPIPVIVAATEAASEAFPKNLTGEVVSVDKGSRRMTVKPLGWLTSEEVTFAVAEPVVPMLANLQPGDRVRVGYVEAHGQLIARAITKVPAECETGR